MFADQPVLLAEIVVTIQAMLAVTAGYPLRNHNAISGFDMMDSVTHFRNNAGRVHSRYKRQRKGNTGQPLTDPEIKVVDGSRLHLYQDICRPDCRSGNGLLHQLFDAAVFVDAYAFHEEFPPFCFLILKSIQKSAYIQGGINFR
jgi:hypothetical protein